MPTGYSVKSKRLRAKNRVCRKQAGAGDRSSQLQLCSGERDLPLFIAWKEMGVDALPKLYDDVAERKTISTVGDDFKFNGLSI